AQFACQRGERIAAIGIGRGREIMRQRLQLGVAAGREDEAIEEFGETLHYSFSSSYPTRCSGRAFTPSSSAQRASASSRPWVIQSSPGAISLMVSVSSSQSA